MDMKKTGEFIAQRRKELGLTQAALAEKLYVTDKAVSKWERGAGLPDIHTLEPLAAALEISLVELVQAKRTEQDTIPLQDAAQLMADTLRLSRETRLHRVMGAGILGCLGGIIVFLLGLLLREGTIVAFSVGSLVTGLLAWAIPVWQVAFDRRHHTAPSLWGSMCAALTSIAIQFFQLAHEVDTGDYAAIEDTIHALCLVVVLFSAVTALLNVWMLRKKKPRTYSEGNSQETPHSH